MLSISSFQMGHFVDMFRWDPVKGYVYWPIWARQAGTMLQLLPLLLIPFAGIVQCVRYLTKGPSDLFEVTSNFHLWKILKNLDDDFFFFLFFFFL